MNQEARFEAIEKRLDVVEKANYLASDTEFIRRFKAVYVANPSFRRWLKSRISERV